MVISMGWKAAISRTDSKGHKMVTRYYMNLRYRDRLFVDEEGDELAHEHAVHGHTLDTARDLIANGRMDSIRNWFECSFEVTNEAGGVVLTMPFSDTIDQN
jgi:hypothetical protein